MEIRTHAEYNATVEEVFAVLTDPEFVAQTVIVLSVAGHSYHVTEQSGTTVVDSRRTLSTADMPDVARKFAGEVLTVDEEQRWAAPRADGSRSAELSLRIEGVPVSLTGTITLTPTGSGTLQDVVADLRAKVPLIGSTIERAAAPAIIAGIDAEADLARQWMNR
jgi:uncharacterized protein YndB with AHSA1/START domain